MAYLFYLKKCLLPVTPKDCKIKVNGKNKKVTLINDGEVNILKKAGLTDIEFECLLPNVRYPFAVYNDGFQNASHFMEYFEELKTSQKPFQFIITRAFPDGRAMYNTNIKVSMEDYQLTESADNGFDVMVKISLKQWKDYGTKTVSVKVSEDSKPKASPEPEPRTTESSPEPKQQTTYTVVAGDCLWAIATKFYGKGSLYTKIYDANPGVFNGRSPNLIYVGDVLTIPEA